MNNLIIDNINSSFSLEQSLSNIINNISKEESILSEILTLQEKILLDTKKLSYNVDSYILINESMNTIIKNIINLKIVTQSELENMQKILDKMNILNEDDEFEE